MEVNQKSLIEIIEKMPQNLTNLQKARYIYIEVCKFYIYNSLYIIGDNEEKTALFDEDIDINKTTSNKAICSSLSRALIYLFQQCDIECNGVYFGGRFDGHMEVAFKVDGKVYEADPARDLMNVKVGYETNGFAKRMRNNHRENFEGYSTLSEEEISNLDKSIGYTFGLSREYLDMIQDRGDTREDYDFKMYLDEAVEEISRELYDYEKISEYITSVHPGINVMALSTQELDTYRIEFLMNYVNTFANDLSYMDKRDFFESLISRTIDCKDDCPKLFNGTTTDNEMITIMKYDGDIADEDLFYLIREGHKIERIGIDEVQALIDGGFKTIGKGKEKFLIKHDRPFQRVTYDTTRRINDYIYNHESSETVTEKEDEMFSYMLLQRLNKAIADCMEALHRAPKEQKLEENPIIKDISQIFYDELQNNGYDYYIDRADIDDEMLGEEHLFKNMQIVKSILEKEASSIISMIEEYKQALKREAKENKIALYHVSTTPPDQMRNGEITPSYNKSQYHQSFGKMVYASTESVEYNPYLMARVNGNGMYKLPIGRGFYLLQGNNVEITKNEEEQAKAISKVPGYIYYLPIDTFEPMVHVKYDNERDEYIMQFDNEWTSIVPMKISSKIANNIRKIGEAKDVSADSCGKNEVYAIEQYSDVTCILEHNQIIVDRGLDRHEIEYVTQNAIGKINVRGILLNMLAEKRVRYFNGEAGINAIRGAKDIYEGPVIKYNAERIMGGPESFSPKEIRNQQVRIADFVKNAVKSGVTYGEYSEIMNHNVLEIEEKNSPNYGD